MIKKYLSRDDYFRALSLTQLVSIDLLIVCHDKLLVGERSNNPAQGSLFVPGGKVYKNEYLTEGLAVCRTMKLSIHRGKELLAFKITCSNSFLPILFFLNESTGWNKRDGALKCAYTLIQTRHNQIFSTWFTQYMHPF